MLFKNMPLAISIICGIAIFLIILGISSVIYQKNVKYTWYHKGHPDDWFLYRFSDKLFGALFGMKDPELIGMKLGIDVEDYYKNCIIVGIEPDIRGIITDYIYGFISLLICLVLTFTISPFFFIIGLLFMLIFMKIKRQIIKNKADALKDQIRAEFPRFLGLLATELEVGLFIDKAIELLSHKYDSLISKEFLNSLNDVKLGSMGWQEALYKISEKYMIDDFSDFVMDVTTAFSKGTSIAQAVSERTRELKSKRLYDVKEKAARTENAILIPIAILQFVPMMAFILLPTLQSVLNL